MQRQDTDSMIEEISLEIEKIRKKNRILPSREEINQRFRTKPYQKVMEKLEMITKYENPIRKLKLLLEARSLITECIDEFWQGIPIK